MARTLAELPEGARLTDYISLGVVAATFPISRVHDILRDTEKTSERQRALPAHVVAYYVIALALYMQVPPGSLAVPVGGRAVAAWTERKDPGPWEVGHFSGEEPVGIGTAAATAR